MTPERWKQIRDVFERVLPEAPPERARILAAAEDRSLVHEVESLLAAHDEATDWLKTAPSARISPEPLIGRTADQYQIHSTLGMGGMGIVYRAWDTQLDRFVALKVPPENISDTAREALVTEAKAASALNHPNIVTIYSTGSSSGIHYIAMELVQGRTLAELIRGGGLSTREAVGYGRQIAEALAAAHGAGVVHRDIKPGNIMVTEAEGGAHGGLVKVLDFGLGSRGETQDNRSPAWGTVSYMSPEQAEGKAVDARSDIFSFGCTFYEMLTGRQAFSGGSRAEVLGRMRGGALPDLASGIPRPCRALVRRCLQPDPDRRVQKADELANALRLIEETLSGRHFRRLAAGVGLVTVAALAVIWFLQPAGRVPDRGQWVQLTRLPDSVSQPALSPDGSRLVFVRGPNTFAGTGQIYVKTLPDGEAIQLTHDNQLKMSPVFSPGGSEISYSTADRQNQWNTWVVPAAGGEPHIWLANAAGLVWLNKQDILFSEIKDRNVHMAIVAADAARTSSRDVYVPAHERGMAHRSYPSPDRQWVLLVEMDPTGVFLPCRLVPMDGHSAGSPVGPSAAACTFAAWSPDGKWMYLSSSSGGTFHTWRQRFPDGKPEQVTSGPTEEEGIAMAPDGRSFITAVSLRQSALWLHDGNDERQVSGEGYSYDPKFAAGGKRLCYRILKGSTPRTSASELHVLDLDSGHSEPLLPGLTLVGGLGLAYDVSPDGREVVAAAVDRDGRSRLWLVPVDQSAPPHQIPGVQGDQPLFGRTGEIVFNGDGSILSRVARDGSGLQKVMRDAALRRGPVSPDGRWVPVRPIGPNGYFSELYSLDGHASMSIAPAGAVDFYLEWSADGRMVFLSISGSVNSDRGRTYAVPLSAGKILPEIPAGGFRSEAQIAALPGAHLIDSLDVAAGPASGVYAFARETLLRNLYRIPIS